MKHRIKRILRDGRLFSIIKWITATLGYTTYPLPFSKAMSAENLLERAIKRVGYPPKEKNDAIFYSYFSETGDDCYEENIARQYETYLPFISKMDGLSFLDVGCGRGEFVSFLNDNGIPSCGIENNESEVSRAVKMHANVLHADLLDYLPKCKDEFSGISMIEVIEHIPFNLHNKILQSIYDAVVPGGIVLIETINLKNPMSPNTFFSDPTHIRPVTMEYLTFLSQWVGFVDVRIIFTGPLAFSRHQSMNPEVAYSNYAVIAKKPSQISDQLVIT